MKKLASHLALAATLAAAAPAFAATSHDSHDAHQQGAAKLTLDHGHKWATDEALRKAMGVIRADLAAKLPAIRAGKLEPVEAKALGDKVEAQVGYIVANCKLPPEADANLHVVVAELVAAADGLKSAEKKHTREAGLRAVKAANTYGKYFDHPQWRPL